MPDYDLIIAGYGPTGAVAANLLGAQGFSVLALDPRPEIFDIPRAVHIDGEIMRIFQVLGLASEIDEGTAEGAYLRFINGWNWRLFSQDMSRISRPNGWANDIFFNQPRMEQILREGVQRYANVEVRLGWALQELSHDAHGVDAGLRQVVGEGPLQRVRCRYLLACDGASSKARELLDLAQEDFQCDEPWLVCDLVLEEDVQHRRDAYQICDPVRPATLAPCEGRHIRWEFMLNADDEVAELGARGYCAGLDGAACVSPNRPQRPRHRHQQDAERLGRHSRYRHRYCSPGPPSLWCLRPCCRNRAAF